MDIVMRKREQIRLQIKNTCDFGLITDVHTYTYKENNCPDGCLNKCGCNTVHRSYCTVTAVYI